VRWLLGAALGVAVFVLTENLWAAVLVGGVVALLSQGRRALPAPSPFPTRTEHETERTTSIEVVCKAVTPERQEWVSSKTGRLYDVLSRHGPPDAQPGDKGVVVLTPSGWRIERSKGGA